MNYKIKLNDEDYTYFNVFYANHSKSGKRQTNISRARFPLLTVLCIMIFIIAGAERGLVVTEAIILSIVSAIWCVFTPQRREKSIRKNISKMKKDGKLPYHAEADVEFQDAMIVERSEQGEIHVNYRDIESIYSYKDYLYIFYSISQAIIIPYHCLGEDKERVTGYIMQKVADRISMVAIN